MIVRCANNQYCQCFFIIVDFICDYEKQIVITNVKNNRHCAICQIFFEKRKQLTKKWFVRTHNSTQQQFQRQKNDHHIRIDDQWIHDEKNFAWKFFLIDVHKTIMTNVLHQLFKNAIMYLMNWIKTFLKIKMSIFRKRKNVAKKTSTCFDLNQLNVRFRRISKFTKLKRFQNFSNVK